MISLLKTFLPIGDIEDIEDIPTEDVGTGAHDKTIRYDLACRTSDGKYAIVEAQVQDQPYFNHRAMFYASRMINYSVININDRLKMINAKRKSEGKQQIIWNYLFSPVFLLSIFKGTDMAEHSDDGCVHTYRMMDVKTGDLLGPDVSITFVELSKYKWDNVASSTEQQWLYTLKNLPVLADMPEWINDDEIREVYAKADLANLPHDIVQNYAEEMTTETDYKIAMQATAIRSLAEGEAKGKAEGKAEIAKAMKLAGEPIEKIILYSGLTSEQVELL